MAFVNEYISQEDMEKYGLIKLMNHYYKLDGRFHPFNPKTRKLSWTIDKERGIWLLNAISMHLPDARDGYTGETFFIIYYKGRKIEVVLNGSQIDRDTDPIKITWKLLRIRDEDIQGLDKEEVFKVLREALDGYGWDGRTDDRYERLGTKRPNVQAELIVEAK